MTFSIVARSDDGESWGVAVASKFLAVGSAVPAAAAGVGAIATQADANLAFKYLGLAHLDDGATAQVALDRLVEEDEGREHRQVGVVDSDGNAATWTGSECFAWAGGTTGRSGERGGYAIQGNILTGPEVVEAMERAWIAAEAPARRATAARGAGRRRRRGRRQPRSPVGGTARRTRRGRLRRARRRRRRPARRRPRRPGHGAGPAGRPQRALPDGVDPRGAGAGRRRADDRAGVAGQGRGQGQLPHVGRLGELRDARRLRRAAGVDRPPDPRDHPRHRREYRA